MKKHAHEEMRTKLLDQYNDELIMTVICPEMMLPAIIITNISILSLDSWHN